MTMFEAIQILPGASGTTRQLRILLYCRALSIFVPTGMRPMSSIRMLLADDYAPWRVQARKLLQQRPDCHITEACDGMEAVQRAAELDPDIVLLDIGMPVLNGIEAAKRIREATPQSKIIFVTQDGDADLKAAALAAGA